MIAKSSSSLTPSLFSLPTQRQQKHEREVGPCDRRRGMECLSDAALFSILRVEQILFLTVWTRQRRESAVLVTDAMCLL